MAKKIFNKVNSIQFRVKFNGEGCVNYDSPEQAYYLKAYGLVKGKLEDNCKLSKKYSSRRTANTILSIW